MHKMRTRLQRAASSGTARCKAVGQKVGARQPSGSTRLLFPAAGSLNKPFCPLNQLAANVSTAAIAVGAKDSAGHVKDVVRAGSLHKAPEAGGTGSAASSELYSMHALNKGGPYWSGDACGRRDLRLSSPAVAPRGGMRGGRRLAFGLGLAALLVQPSPIRFARQTKVQQLPCYACPESAMRPTPCHPKPRRARMESCFSTLSGVAVPSVGPEGQRRPIASFTMACWQGSADATSDQIKSTAATPYGARLGALSAQAHIPSPAALSTLRA